MSDWQEASLADLADYINGRAIKPEECSAGPGMPVIRIKQINDPQTIDDCFCGDNLDEKNIVRNGDLLFSWSATLKTIQWQGPAGAINQHIFKVMPRPGIDKTFLHYLIDNSIPALAEESHGSTMKHIKKSALSAFHLRIPPLPEQKKIAEILSGIDNLIKMIDIKILKLKIAIAEVFRDVFSDFSPTEEEAVFPQDISKSIKTLPLESVCEAVVDCKNRTPPYVDQGYPVIRTPNVRNGRLVIADLRYTDEESYQIWTARSVPRPMDILFTREAPLGEACLIPNGFRCCLGQRMMLFRANKSLLDPQYLLYAMMSTFVQEQLGKSKGGTTVGHARVADIRKIKIPILPMEKQLQIAFLLASINSCLQQTIEKKKKMQVKKNALASDLLSGRKRVST